MLQYIVQGPYDNTIAAKNDFKWYYPGPAVREPIVQGLSELTSVCGRPTALGPRLQHPTRRANAKKA